MARLFDDASNEYLLASGTTLGISDYPFTMAAWFNSDTAVKQTVIGFGDADAVAYHRLYLRDPSDLNVWAYSRNPTHGGRFAVTSTQWSTATWHHACAVFTATNNRAVFLDGGGKGTNAVQCDFDAVDQTGIGANVDSSVGDKMSGSIAEVAVWNVALTDAEVAILAAGYSPLFVRPQNLVAYWPLIRGLTDPVGGYDMTASGTVVSVHPRIIRPAPMPYYGITIPAVGGGIVVLRRRRM